MRNRLRILRARFHAYEGHRRERIRFIRSIHFNAQAGSRTAQTIAGRKPITKQSPGQIFSVRSGPFPTPKRVSSDPTLVSPPRGGRCTREHLPINCRKDGPAVEERHPPIENTGTGSTGAGLVGSIGAC